MWTTTCTGWWISWTTPRVRSHLDERGQERGRPFTLAVRVSETMEACRLDGFEVAAWVKEDLVDMIVLGSGAIDIEVEASGGDIEPTKMWIEVFY